MVEHMTSLLDALSADVSQWPNELPGIAAHGAMLPLLQNWRDAGVDAKQLPLVQQDLQDTIAYLMELQLRLSQMQNDAVELPESHHTSARTAVVVAQWGQGSELDFRQFEQMHRQWLGQWPASLSSAGRAVEQAYAPYLKDGAPARMWLWLQRHPDIATAIQSSIQSRQSSNVWFQQRITLACYWLLSTRRQAFLLNWPLDRGAVRLIAMDLGISLRGW